MAMLLLSVRTQLTSLCSLSLIVAQRWQDAQLVWAELANMTKLKHLRLMFATWLAAPVCSSGDLLSLSSLCSLELLRLDVPAALGPSPVSLDLVRTMPALTRLQLWTTNTIQSVPGFVVLQQCTNLVSLSLTWSRGVHLMLDQQGWQTMAQLTRLTMLVLWPVVVDDAMSTACFPALRQLTCLKDVSAEAWTPNVLAVFATLPQLSSVGGGWLHGEVPVGVVCRQVLQLDATYGDVPSVAMPQLTSIMLDNALSTQALSAVGKHCKELEALLLDRWPNASGNGWWFSLQDGLGGGPAWDVQGAQVLAIHALTSLHTLTRLAFCPSSNIQLIACVGAAIGLCRHKLKRLELVMLPGAGVSREGLLHLGRLPTLGELYLRLRDDGILCTSADALAFISAVGTVRSLHVVLPTDEQVQVLQEGYGRCLELGLKVPAGFEVEEVLD